MPKLKTSIFLFLLIFLFETTMYAQEKKVISTPENVIKKIKEKSAKTISIVADFTEKKYLAYMKEPHSSSGKFYYKKDNKMRWEQLAPFDYILLVNEDEVIIRDNGEVKENAMSSKVMEKIKNLMLTIINGDFTSNKSFISTYFESEDIYIVELQPTMARVKKIYDMIVLSFDRNSLHLKTLTFIEASGDKSVMTFSNEQFNTEIAEIIFTKF
jgi:outer membrane lipoprotein-sorting protein